MDSRIENAAHGLQNNKKLLWKVFVAAWRKHELVFLACVRCKHYKNMVMNMQKKNATNESQMT